MRLHPRCFFLATLAAFILSLVAARPASAQSINVVQEESLPRVGASGSPVPKRPLTMNPEGVNRQDCLEEQGILVPLQLTGYEANGVLEAWASIDGHDCSVQTNRIGAARVCWTVADAIPLQPTSTVDIRVQRLLAGTLREGTDPVRACQTVERTTFTVQFLYFRPGQLATPAVSKQLVLRADTVGNPPPVGLTAVPATGNAGGSVAVKWTAQAPGTSLDMGVYVYCAVNGAPGGCSSTNLLPGSLLDGAPQARCAAAIGDAVSGAVVGTTPDGQPLVEGTSYVFAAASVDDFGNVGPLSDVACAAPTSAADESSSSSSSCAVSPSSAWRPRGAGRFAFASAFALALAGAIVRARRRRA